MMSDVHGVRISEKDLRARLAASTVAIVGCGGLGSNAAAMLLRSGVKSLVLIDFDRVEESNLNRQLYFRDQIGMVKTEALAETLTRIDDTARLTLVNAFIDESTLVDAVRGADVILEAVDRADTKAMIVKTCTRDLPDTPIVAASGLAGYDAAELITPQRMAESVWMIGDFVADVREGHSLLASRVMVAAAHQAHMAIRILLGLEEA